MKGFAYMYTVLILSVIVISITAYFLVSYSVAIEGMHTYSSTRPYEFTGLIPVMYSVCAGGLNTTMNYLLTQQARTLRQLLSSLPGTGPVSGERKVTLRSFNWGIYDSFTKYSSLLDEALSHYGAPTALAKLSNVSTVRYTAIQGYQRSLVNFTYVIIPVNLTTEFLVTAPQSQIGNITIPTSITVVSHKVRLLLGTLSTYDVALNVSLTAYSKIGKYTIPVTFKKVSAWKLTYSGVKFILSDKIPVDVLKVGTGHISFKVGISLVQKTTYIFMKVDLTTGESIYIVSEIYMVLKP